ncbi:MULTISPECIES: BlaI/MecI/CopY family transcriptional regulator [Aeromicrobium]|uniref:BlaI/MecI/CopY family transcriptional regulator n=1 Tax=Aeromicrobium TaxID=2040 RepID=UPI0009EC770C|nr:MULTISPECIES: BlaI/MecI/CopY family transcriptional regulator [Aeromicrobium]MBD8608096.1 BlaI/MecI/CopY family transcriptional regulator [Aeromicrobium sp. CFBP 8757]MCL8253114.1 BlaI/MecI/CopY family transcriptional regulator [Aeromicrobium fastidiosum]
MPRLGELERSVMNVLWDAPAPLTVREVLDALGERDLAYTTIMTVLDRLGTKEMVRRERDGRAFHYAPALSRDEATSELLHAALDEAGTDRTAALVHFARTVDPDEAKALRAALDEIVSRTSP